MQPLPDEVRFRFDQYEVDVAAAELKRNGRKVPIQDKPLRLLAYLAQRSGEVVSRAEIQEYLWPPDTTVVYDDGLNTAVKKLREALNDNSDKPKYVETVRRRGYRFLSKVEPAEAVVPVAPVVVPAPVEVVSAEIVAPTRRVQRPLRVALGAAAAIVLCLASGGWLLHRNHVAAAAAAPGAGGQHSVAVLPIANLTGNAGLTYLCDGATEEIIARLGDEDPELVRVIARTSSMSLRDTTLSAREIGTGLGVDYVVESTLRGDEGHLRIIANLIRVSDETQVWTQTYMGAANELQLFENDIADRTARALPGFRKPARGPQQTLVTAEAHDLYLKGLHDISQRSRLGFEDALVNLGSAVQKEPRYPEAYAELAVSYNLMGQYDWMRQEEARSQGRAAALQALALDPTLAEARAALGFSYWFYDWDNVRGKQELLSAVARDPNNVDAHHWLAMVMITTGELDQAEQQMHAALALDPAAPILKTNLGWVHYAQARYPLAVQELSAVTKQYPDFYSAHVKLIWACSMMGDQQRAWSELQMIAAEQYPADVTVKMRGAYAKGGLPAAMTTIATLPAGNFYANDVDHARDLMFAGDKIRSLELLQDGIRRRDGWMILVPTDPAFASLHNTQAFQDILHHIKPMSAAPHETGS